MYAIKELEVKWEDDHLVCNTCPRVLIYQAIVWKPSGVAVGVPTREGKTMANFVQYSLKVGRSLLFSE
jgi:hypothetical protein